MIRTALASLLLATTLTACSQQDDGSSVRAAAQAANATQSNATQPEMQPAADAQPTQLCYAVDGMHCEGCAEAITAELKEIKGVASVQCTFDSHRAVVQVASAALAPQVEKAITKLGYKVAPCEAASSK
ncbi:MAG: heavy-metal-associated domain-containing protein [Phycisphaerales bacterium]